MVMQMKQKNQKKTSSTTAKKPGTGRKGCK